MVAVDLALIVESTVMQDLGRASELTDTSWIRPGRVAGSSWSDIDSAEQGCEHMLVDANRNVHSERDLRELVHHAYRVERGSVPLAQLRGPHNDVTEQPRDLVAEPAMRRTEMARIAEWGIAGATRWSRSPPLLCGGPVARPQRIRQSACRRPLARCLCRVPCAPL